MKKPLIGITLDSEEAGGYAKWPWYAIRKDYAYAVEKAGGIPIHLGYHHDAVETYIEMLDGLLFTGGDFDLPPSMYGDDEQHEKTLPKEDRTAFEVPLFEAMFERKKPILGICAGEQLMAVLLGANMIQDIPSQIENCLEHDQEPMNEIHHPIEIVEGTLLHKIAGKTEEGVNTSHHQAVNEAGSKGLVINCRAPDGVVEGVEYPDHPFCLGVEWHPEYLVTDTDRNIFKAFIKACNAS